MRPRHSLVVIDLGLQSTPGTHHFYQGGDLDHPIQVTIALDKTYFTEPPAQLRVTIEVPPEEIAPL